MFNRAHTVRRRGGLFVWGRRPVLPTLDDQTPADWLCRHAYYGMDDMNRDNINREAMKPGDLSPVQVAALTARGQETFMSGYDEPALHDPFTALNLPEAVHYRALKLLSNIAQATTVADTLHAADRAEGFVLGIETVKALNPGAIETLYLVFDDASQVRQAALDE